MRTPKQCADVLAAIFNDATKTGGVGAYKIAREDLKEITGRPIWHQTIIEDVADWLVELGLILIDRDAEFYVMEPVELSRFPRVDASNLAAHSYPVKFGDARTDA